MTATTRSAVDRGWWRETALSQGASRAVSGLSLALFGALALEPASESSWNAGPLLIGEPPLLDLLVAPVAAAAGAVGLFQIVAAIAGRGRGVPGTGSIPVLRPLMLGAVLLAELLWIASGAGHRSISYGLSVKAFLVLPGVLVVALAAIAAGSGLRSGILAPLALLAAAYHVWHPGPDPRWSSWGGGPADPGDRFAIACNLAAPILAGLLLVHVLRLDRARLARLGITPWAPGDLALIGPVLLVGATVAFESARRGTPADIFTRVAEDLQREPALGLPACAAVLALLVNLSRLIDAVEAQPPRAAPAPVVE